MIKDIEDGKEESVEPLKDEEFKNLAKEMRELKSDMNKWSNEFETEVNKLKSEMLKLEKDQNDWLGEVKKANDVIGDAVGITQERREEEQRQVREAQKALNPPN